jgi:hypothetical protein
MENSDVEDRYNIWMDVNLKASYTALAREWHTSENLEEFNRCQAALARNARELRELSVEDDH